LPPAYTQSPYGLCVVAPSQLVAQR